VHSFAKNLARHRSENNFLGQNNYVEHLSIDDNATKLFLDLYLAKFLDIWAKPYFLCT